MIPVRPTDVIGTSNFIVQPVSSFGGFTGAPLAIVFPASAANASGSFSCMLYGNPPLAFNSATAQYGAGMDITFAVRSFNCPTAIPVNVTVSIPQWGVITNGTNTGGCAPVITLPVGSDTNTINHCRITWNSGSGNNVTRCLDSVNRYNYLSGAACVSAMTVGWTVTAAVPNVEILGMQVLLYPLDSSINNAGSLLLKATYV